MYDQTQSYQPASGMGGERTSSTNFDDSLNRGQIDKANLSKKLRVRIAGTALFTVGLGALAYSMTSPAKNSEEDSDDGSVKPIVNSKVTEELPPNQIDYLGNPVINHSPSIITTPEPVQPKENRSDNVLIGPPPHNLHDFSSHDDFSKAFAHARAELGGPGQIFIYRGKPYTTNYKDEVQDGVGFHVKEGLDIEIVISETDNGRIIAADTDKDGIADKWYIENNDTRYEIFDNDKDGRLDSYMLPDGKLVMIDEEIEMGDVVVPPLTHDIVTIDGVEFLAYDNDSNGQFDKLIGEYEGKYLCYEDTDGDGSFDHGALVSHDLSKIEHSWDISPMNITHGHIEIPDNFYEEGEVIDDTTIDTDEISITTQEDLDIIEDDPYRVDIENEINSGDLNNHTDMSSFAH